jgi:cardiolipin synthase
VILTGLLALYAIWAVGAIGGVLAERRSPTSTLAWIFAFLALPGISGVYFVVFGPRRLVRRRRRYVTGRKAVERVAPVTDAVPLEPPADALARLATQLGMGAPERTDEVMLLPDGDSTLAAIEAAIAAATHHVHVEYYIWDPDRVGTRIRDALVAAAKRDVDVRVVYDDIGSGADAAFFKPLINAGGKAREFNSVRITTNLGLANFRTHRKIVVCDGVVGFCGGNNLHDPISAEVTGKSAWRDLHVRIRGDAVHQLQRVFLENWMYTRGRFSPDAEERPRYFPPQTSTGPAAQVLASGPDGDEAAIYRFVLGAMATARQRVWIQTPYLIPDEPFESALQVAVLRGVDVRILVPLEGDSKLVGAASRTWCESLVRTGVTIHEYTPRMLHAKALLVDEVVGVVGTANMDNRSFRLNFEVMVAIYDAAFVRQLAARMETDAAESRPFRGRGRGHRLTAAFESLARLASPIL